MKGEHRKELQTNILADRMGRFMHDMRSQPQSRSAAIIVLIGLAIVTYLAWQVTMARTDRTNQWTRLDEDLVGQIAMNSPENETGVLVREFDRVSNEAPYTLAGRTARFQRARLLLSTGMTRLYAASPGETSAPAKDLEKARDLFRELVNQTRDEPILTQEAMMGAAQAEEALVGVPNPEDVEKAIGNLDHALADYRALATSYPTSHLGQQAAARVKKIEENRKQMDEFYATMRKEAANRPVFGLAPGDDG
ncbi:MAG: tol-pal system YbgF family protein [Gemmataceae bacterium]